MDLNELRQRRSEILQLAAHHGASNVRVFGSVARSEADRESDVDLLVDLAPDRTLLDLGGLVMDLNTLLGVPVDVMTEEILRDQVRERALREAVLL